MKHLKTMINVEILFMINRFFSIKHPTTAQSLNFNGINPIGVVDFWQIFARRMGKVPGWIYTKTKKIKRRKNPKYGNLILILKKFIWINLN